MTEEQIGLFSAPPKARPTPASPDACGCGQPRGVLESRPWLPPACDACEVVLTWDPVLNAAESQRVMRGQYPGRCPVSVGSRGRALKGQPRAPIIERSGWALGYAALMVRSPIPKPASARPERPAKLASEPGYPVTRLDSEGLTRWVRCPKCEESGIQVLAGVGSWVTCQDCRTVFLIHESNTLDPLA